MPDFKFTDSTPEPEDVPDLAQHSDFHFTDKEIEEQIQADKKRRQAELDAELAAPPKPKLLETDDDFTFIDTPLSLADEPKQRPANPARPVAPPQAPTAPAPPAAGAQAAAATPQAPAANTGQRLQAPNIASPKAPTASRPAARPAAGQVPTPTIPSPVVGQATISEAPQATAPKPGGARPGGPKTASGVAASGAANPAAKNMAVGTDVAANLKHAAIATNATVDPVYKEEELPAWRQMLNKLDPVFNFIFMLASIAGGLSLAYILWGIFGGGIGQTQTDPARAALFAHNILIASKILSFSLFCAAIAGIMLLLDESWIGPGIAIVGLGLHFGAVPIFNSIGQTRAVTTLILASRSIGYALIILGFLKCFVDIVRWLIDLPNRARLKADVGSGNRAEASQQRVAANANMFSPCWQLPFCREVIRKQCPAYLAKKRCWKFGRGCYCDEEMISRIVRGESDEQVKAPTRMSRQGKPPCGRCYIFLEHQNLKYKVLSPLAVPVTVLGMYAIWGQMMNGMNLAGHGLQGVWAKLSFTAVTATTTAAPEAIDVYKLSADEVQHVAMSMFGVIFGFFALIYISKFIEWAIYKARW